MPLGTEVNLGPGEVVLDRVPRLHASGGPTAGILCAK